MKGITAVKTIEQIALETANKFCAPYISDEAIIRFAKQFLAAYLAQQTPVAWGVFYFGGKMNGSLYSQCGTKEQAERYIGDLHQSDDTNTFRCAPLFLAPPPAVQEGYVLVPEELLERFKELNPSNYGHDDVCELNAWAVELVLAAAAPKGEQK